ncbi:TOPRIM nucleotidyl transferase/hydrolase domain-containing protein [Fusobacterium polymorphum]
MKKVSNMEYFQIIFVHEGDTDELYIRKLVDKLYPELKENGNKLTFISMNGKTNYIKMERKIEELLFFLGFEKEEKLSIF